MRRKLFEIIEPDEDGNKISKYYDIFMMVIIFLSIVPLCFKQQKSILVVIDKITAIIFIADYVLRIATADFINGKRKMSTFLLYPFRPMAIMDLLSILPSVTFLNPALRVFKVFRLFKTLRVFKFFRYSKNVKMILAVIKRKMDSLIAVAIVALAYIFISALILFQIEPDTFNNFFDALYWSTVSLTTVGYGDIYPVSDIGRFIGMISSFLGIAIVALPSGIIVSGYQEELDEQKNQKK